MIQGAKLAMQLFSKVGLDPAELAKKAIDQVVSMTSGAAQQATGQAGNMPPRSVLPGIASKQKSPDDDE
jgi:hypothetical protein